MTIEEILIEEYEKITAASSNSEKCNIQYNIIKLKLSNKQVDNIYKDIKQFIDAYIETIKLADYGYDNFNYVKLEQLIELLPSNQQIGLLQYITSVAARELPEHDRTWFVSRIHKAEINQILESRNFLLYPKTFLLYLGQSISRLLLGLTSLFLLTCIIMLPAPIESLAVFNITFENYSQNSFLNHLMNVLSLFADLDNNFKIQPLNFLGLTLIILGKLIFVTFIINFIYYKISDKISQK